MPARLRGEAEGQTSLAPRPSWRTSRAPDREARRSCSTKTACSRTRPTRSRNRGETERARPHGARASHRRFLRRVRRRSEPRRTDRALRSVSLGWNFAHRHAARASFSGWPASLAHDRRRRNAPTSCRTAGAYSHLPIAASARRPTRSVAGRVGRRSRRRGLGSASPR